MYREKIFLLKPKLLLFILVLSCFFIGQNAFAEGDGTGGGKSEPLTLVSSSIANGTTGVPLKPEIKLTFSKNIVNMAVRDENMKCFSLQTINGTSVPIDIIMADDQIDFEKRNDAIIIPKADLEKGSFYSVVISPSLTAKSGATTGQVIKLTFTTEGTQSSANNEQPKETPKTETPVSQISTPAKTQPIVSKTPTTTNTTNAANTAKTTNTKSISSENNEKSSSNQNETNLDPQTKTDKVETENFIPYKAAKAIKTKNQKTKMKENKSNPLLVVGIVISLIAIIAAGTSYFYIKKKKVKY